MKTGTEKVILFVLSLLVARLLVIMMISPTPSSPSAAVASQSIQGTVFASPSLNYINTVATDTGAISPLPVDNLLVPTGTIAIWVGYGSIPAGWLLCAGGIIAAPATGPDPYVELRDVLQFYLLPDFTTGPDGCILVGHTSANNSVGAVDEGSSDTISLAYPPAHEHYVGSVNFKAPPYYAYLNKTFDDEGGNYCVVAIPKNKEIGIKNVWMQLPSSTQHSGSGTPVSVVQPTAHLQYIIKY